MMSVQEMVDTERLEAPEQGTLTELQTQLKQYYQGRNRAYAEQERLFMLRFSEDMARPEWGEDAVLPTGHRLIMDTAAVLSAELPTIEVPPIGGDNGGETARALSAKLKRYFTALWWRYENSQPEEPLLQTTFFWLLLRGAAWHKTVYNPDKWPDKPLEPKRNETAEDFNLRLAEIEGDRRRNIAIEVLNRDPQTILHEPARKPTYVFETYKRTVADILYAWPEARSHLVGRRQTELVDWSEFWNKRWCSYMVDGRLFYRWEHRYGLMPYSGVKARAVPLTDPETWAMGMLWSVRGLVRYETHLFRQNADIIRRFAWLNLLVWSDDPEGLNISGDPGEIIYLSDAKKERVEFAHMNDTPRGLTDQWSKVSREVSNAVLSEAAQGNVKGSTSGYDTIARVQTARARFEPMRKAIQGLIQADCEHIAMIHRNKVGEPMTIWGQDNHDKSIEEKVGPRDLIHFRCKVSLNVPGLSDEAQDETRGLHLRQAGVIDFWTFVEKYAKRLGDPDEVMKRMLAEELIRSDEMKQIRLEEVSDSWLSPEHRARLQQLRQAAQMQAQSGQQGMPGAPQPAAAMGPPGGGPPGAPRPGMGPPGPPRPQMGPPGGARPPMPQMAPAAGGIPLPPPAMQGALAGRPMPGGPPMPPLPPQVVAPGMPNPSQGIPGRPGRGPLPFRAVGGQPGLRLRLPPAAPLPRPRPMMRLGQAG